MTDELNPQRRQMADESMERNLRAQAECLWPQERELVAAYGLPASATVLDAGCGTGEVTARLAELFPHGDVLGVDVLPERVEGASRRWASLAPRVRFERRSIYELGLPGETFDLVACRHVVQSIPDVPRVLAELRRVLRPGGRLHLLAEDYGMLHFPVRRTDPDELWHHGPPSFGRATGTDMRVGRHAFRLLREAGFRDVRVDYVLADTQRCPRETLATIFEAWRDGYSEVLAEHSHLGLEEIRATFDDVAASIRDPDSYGAWFVPIVSGVR
jgi:SAM-dependent methyltransferase